jgi:hypothetical protein
MSSRHSRRAAIPISGRRAPATRRTCPKPGRSECTSTASIIAVRGRPSGPGRSGVAWVSTTLPAPSPSTISIVIVRASGQLNSARTGTPSRFPTVNVTSRRNRSSAGGASGAGALSTRNAVNEYGWNQTPCHGSSRLAITSSGSHRPITVATAATAWSAGRGPSTGASVGVPSAGSPAVSLAWSPAVSSRRTQASTPSSKAGSGRQPGRPVGPSAIPCQRHMIVPSCTGASHSAAPRCGQAPGPTCSRPAPSRQATSSRPATTRPNARPGRTSRLPARTCQPPVGRACARCRAAPMRDGVAAAHVGRCCAHGVRLIRRNGLVGRRSFTAPRLGPAGGPGDPATPAQSHPLRRKTRRSPRQVATITSHTAG